MRSLGSSDLQVSAIGLGTMSWPGCNYGEKRIGESSLDRETVRASVRAALEEESTSSTRPKRMASDVRKRILGTALEEDSARERAIIVTKVGPLFGDELAAGRTCNLTAEHIFRRCEGSLRRLRTDHIDLYLAHWPDPQRRLSKRPSWRWGSSRPTARFVTSG